MFQFSQRIWEDEKLKSFFSDVRIVNCVEARPGVTQFLLMFLDWTVYCILMNVWTLSTTWNGLVWLTFSIKHFFKDVNFCLGLKYIFDTHICVDEGSFYTTIKCRCVLSTNATSPLVIPTQALNRAWGGTNYSYNSERSSVYGPYS